jgi:hypothetical protein
MDRGQALALVYEAIDVVNQQLPAGRRLAKSPETILVGPGGALDSLGIVNMVVTLEERAGEATGAPVVLLDDDAVVDEQGALRSVDSLARFLERLPG